MKKHIKSKPLFTIQCYEDRQPTTPIRIEGHTDNEMKNGDKLFDRKDVQKPPPPPPMPMTNGHDNGAHTKLENQKIVTNDAHMMKVSNANKINTLDRTPTPDYNKKNDYSGPLKANHFKPDNAEVDSLESYKLRNPINVQPKPPSNYFQKAPNGTETMKKHVRPVSVTIGQYVNTVGNRKEPSKLDFLNGDKTDGKEPANNEPISSRLQTELALTLSRSNLRKKTEALGDGGR